MPTLVLKIAPLQNPARYQSLADALTELTVQGQVQRFMLSGT